MLSKIHNHLRSILQVALIAKHSRDDFHATQKPTWIVKFLASFFSVCLLFAFHVFFPSVSFVSFCFFDFDRQSQFFFPGNYQAFRGFMHAESNRRASFFPIVADVPFSFLFAFDCHRFGCDFVSTTRTTIGRELATYFPFSATSHRGHCF